MSTVPKGWTRCTIRELASHTFDGPFGSNLRSLDYTSHGVLVARLENVGWLNFDCSKKTFISENKFSKLTRHELKTGDILVGSFVDDRVRVCRLPDNLEHRIINKADVFCLRIDDCRADAEYVLYKIASRDVYEKFIETAVHGATRPRISLSDLKNLTIELPPLAEQRRIVKKIKSLFARSKRAHDELARLKHLTIKYREAVLAAAFDSPPSAPAMYQHGRTSVLKFLAERIKNGLSVAGSDIPPGTPALKLSALRSDTVDLTEVRYLMIDHDRATKFSLRQGDILVTRGNGAIRLVGKAALVPNGCEGTIFPDTAFRLRPNLSIVDPHWLLWMWNAPQMRTQIEGAARTTAGIWKISQADIGLFELPNVPLARQREIVRHIELAFLAIGRLAAEAESAKALVSQLNQTILAKAFRGELVPQDPDDEPAGILLDRIQAERAAASAASKRDRRSRATTGA